MYCTLALSPWWSEPLMSDSESHEVQRPRLLDMEILENYITGGVTSDKVSFCFRIFR